MFTLYDLFISICIDVYIIIFKFNVIDEFKTMVLKSILIYLLDDYYIWFVFNLFCI
jgi:hypothetical protein